MCMTMRGSKKSRSRTVTFVTRGVFRQDEASETVFELVKDKNKTEIKAQCKLENGKKNQSFMARIVQHLESDFKENEIKFQMLQQPPTKNHKNRRKDVITYNCNVIK